MLENESGGKDPRRRPCEVYLNSRVPRTVTVEPDTRIHQTSNHCCVNPGCVTNIPRIPGGASSSSCLLAMFVIRHGLE